MISQVFAQTTSPAPMASGSSNLFLLVALVAVFWLLLIRPQQKRAKTHLAMINSLKVGDEIITGGGMLGKIADLSEGIAVVEVANNVKVKIQRHTITALVPKGSVEQAK